MGHIMNVFTRLLARLLGSDKLAYAQAIVSRDVAQDITRFAHSTHPREFSAYLKGVVKNGMLRVNGLEYQHYWSDETETVVQQNLPLLSEAVGFVHSHPDGPLKPSRTDLRSFAKEGIFHLIVGPRRGYYGFAAFDGRGRRVPFSIA